MSMIETMMGAAQWEQFLAYKELHGHLRQSQLSDLQQFCNERDYLPILNKIISGVPFSPPKKSLIRKMNTSKKRTVYTFDRPENYVLKILTYLLLRKYDGLFCDNLYSFRVRHGAKQAMQRILQTEKLDTYYTYKVDISDYFNSVDIDLLLPVLKRTFCDDIVIYHFFEQLLCSSAAIDQGRLIAEKKGIMAGTPTAVFLANLYLMDLDAQCKAINLLYFRYSDDILILAKTEEERVEAEQMIRLSLSNHRLNINHDKEVRTNPHEKWSFLGVSYQNGVVDISDISIDKLKAKMRRKMRALLRWKAKKGVSCEQVASALIRNMNHKFFDAEDNHELTWARWYFPIINTDKGLKILDAYLQECIRYLATETRTNARFSFRYEQMKVLGYQSLVNAWYKYKSLL